MIDVNQKPRSELEATIHALIARLAAEPSPVPAAQSLEPDDDRMLSTGEVASLLGISEKTVYRSYRKWTFARRIGPKNLRFSLKGLRAWQARQRI
jgi:predicted DNA-binding transcriptional regulator AlpA